MQEKQIKKKVYSFNRDSFSLPRLCPASWEQTNHLKLGSSFSNEEQPS